MEWLKAEGDKLEKGESIVVVESDKADMDVETFYEGFLELLHEEYATAAGCEVAQLRSTAEDGEWEARIQDGRFGEMMVVSLENDGPVTICDEV